MGRSQRETRARKNVTEKPCEWCGWDSGLKHAAHIIDKGLGPMEEWNLISLCPNCARTFDDVLKPRLILALKKWLGQGNSIERLELCWGRSQYKSRFSKSPAERNMRQS